MTKFKGLGISFWITVIEINAANNFFVMDSISITIQRHWSPNLQLPPRWLIWGQWWELKRRSFKYSILAHCRSLFSMMVHPTPTATPISAMQSTRFSRISPTGGRFLKANIFFIFGTALVLLLFVSLDNISFKIIMIFTYDYINFSRS